MAIPDLLLEADRLVPSRTPLRLLYCLNDASQTGSEGVTRSLVAQANARQSVTSLELVDDRPSAVGGADVSDAHRFRLERGDD